MLWEIGLKPRRGISPTVREGSSSPYLEPSLTVGLVPRNSVAMNISTRIGLFEWGGVRLSSVLLGAEIVCHHDSERSFLDFGSHVLDVGFD